jgi:hypothetical protein
MIHSPVHQHSDFSLDYHLLLYLIFYAIVIYHFVHIVR